MGTRWAARPTAGHVRLRRLEQRREDAPAGTRSYGHETSLLCPARRATVLLLRDPRLAAALGNAGTRQHRRRARIHEDGLRHVAAHDLRGRVQASGGALPAGEEPCRDDPRVLGAVVQSDTCWLCI